MKNIFHGKLGTQPPTMIQLRYHYKLKPGKKVVYRVVGSSFGLDNLGPWMTRRVNATEPVLFLER